MNTTETKKAAADVWEALRKPFPKESISKMPRGGIILDYVGHAAITDRLNNTVGPEHWDLEPLSLNPEGSPVITVRKNMAVMWCRLTILGAAKLCVGTAQVDKFEVEKELIGDAIRNGAMRFGVALDLWSKDELESQIAHKPEVTPEATEEPSRQVTDEPISNTSKQKVRLAFAKSGLNASEITEHCQVVINKEAPTTEQDAEMLLKSLEF